MMRIFGFRLHETEFYYQVDVLRRLFSRDTDSRLREEMDEAAQIWRWPKKKQRQLIRRVRRLWIELAMNPPLGETLTEMLARKARDHKRYGISE